MQRLFFSKLNYILDTSQWVTCVCVQDDQLSTVQEDLKGIIVKWFCCVQGDQQRLALAQEALTKATQEARESLSVAASERKRSACPLHCAVAVAAAAHPPRQYLHSRFCNRATLTLHQRQLT